MRSFSLSLSLSLGLSCSARIRGILRVACAMPRVRCTNCSRQKLNCRHLKFIFLSQNAPPLYFSPSREKASVVNRERNAKRYQPGCMRTSFYRLVAVHGVQPSVTEIPVATEFTFGVLITNERHLLSRIAPP